jgi:lipoprotein-anchoring transpeptidase ErfK/SrfK
MKSISKVLRSSKVSMAVLLMAAAPALSQAAAESGVPRVHREIFVSIPDRKLAVVENGQVIRTFAVAVGAAISPSPTGDFQIVNRVSNPTYYHPGVVISAGRDNPIGTRWVGLDRKGYGIHGTNEPRSIGKAASHGCIRMRNRDIEQFFTLVRAGDVVHIRSERDQQIAAMFVGSVTNTVVAGTEIAAEQAGGGQ